jgi:hypothetical protein
MFDVVVHYDGLKELGRALVGVDQGLLGSLKKALEKAGDNVRVDAARRFAAAGGPSAAKTAAGFDSRVRLGGGSSQILTVGQKLRKTTGKHPEYGSLQVSRALLPAREAKYDETVAIVEAEVGGLLRRHGF